MVSVNYYLTMLAPDYNYSFFKQRIYVHVGFKYYSEIF